MTWLPASVEKKHGHILVSPLHDMYQDYHRNRYRIKPVTLLSLLEIRKEPTPYHFHTANGSFYYVNGRREIYETNIINPPQVVFDPLGREWFPETRIWGRVEFRKLHKLEWLFG